MTSMENKVVSAILAIVRARREASVRPKVNAQADSGKLPQARIREACFSDLRSVTELKHRCGLFEDSIQTWEHLWKRNPAVGDMRSQPPIGWVLEAQDNIVGYLGNVPLLCRYGDRTLTAVVGHGMAVDVSYRALSLSLVAAFYRQQSIDLFLATTAIEAVGRMAQAFGAKALPQADYDTPLFWVLRPYPFAEAIMRMLRIKSWPARVGSILSSSAVTIDKGLRRRWPQSSPAGLVITEISVKEIGNNFHNLWIEKVNERPRLLADRSPATLRWHFEIPCDRGTTAVLCCSKNGELLGYAVIRDEGPDERNGLRTAMVADLLVKKDDVGVTKALLAAAYYHSKKTGSHILEVLGYPQSIRDVCTELHPYARKLRANPYNYKAADPVMHRMLSDATAWYACPYDGDSTLTTRLLGLRSSSKRRE